MPFAGKSQTFSKGWIFPAIRQDIVKDQRRIASWGRGFHPIIPVDPDIKPRKGLREKTPSVGVH